MTMFPSGQLVRLKADPKKAGMVVAEMNWGDNYSIRFFDTLKIDTFHAIEIIPFEVEELEGSDNIVSLADHRHKGKTDNAE